EAGWKKAPDMPGAAKLVIELDHDRITQLSDVEVKSAGLDGRLAVAVSEDGKQIERVDIRRMIAGDNDFSGTVTRHPGGGWHADIHAVGVADNVVGGRLAINGQLSSSPDAQTMHGHIEGANYSVARAPVMARVLALPSFTGILSMLSGDGLPFGTLRGDFTLSSGRVTIKNLLAFGEALGITASGWVDTERN